MRVEDVGAPVGDGPECRAPEREDEPEKPERPEREPARQVMHAPLVGERLPPLGRVAESVDDDPLGVFVEGGETGRVRRDHADLGPRGAEAGGEGREKRGHRIDRAARVDVGEKEDTPERRPRARRRLSHGNGT